MTHNFRSRAKRAEIIKLKWILSENEIRLRPNMSLAISESDSRNSARLSRLVNEQGMTPTGLKQRKRTGINRELYHYEVGCSWRIGQSLGKSSCGAVRS